MYLFWIAKIAIVSYSQNPFENNSTKTT